jgi:hypothetical protein
MDGRGFRDANGAAACMAKADASMIFMGQYDSDFKMRDAVTQIGSKFYASGTSADGTIEVHTLTANFNDPSVLEPLTEFGFTIKSAPQFGS